MLVGETMDMPLSALDMSIDMADAGELNPGFLSQVLAEGILFLTLHYVLHLQARCTLACSCPASPAHRAQEPVHILFSLTRSTGC